ncbi:MAG: sulfotransferase [Fuerstiella sp.]|jgi:hypothetical protein|nr:sulfotransferase [Fuerstiella sp.]MDG2127340.1 sulfotransferase [Fuerstiella sp.]
MTWSPAFIGIGAEKSATTWAWTVLNEHPSICMSQPKELNYFNDDDNFRRGESWYRKHFAVQTSCSGEISPLYMDDDRVAERIRDVYPDTRILAMLRNPFDRAISHLFHDASVIYGNVAGLTPDDLLTLARKNEKYIRRSCYASQLKPFLKHFPPEQIRCFFFDDVKADGLCLAQQLYEFVGVSPNFVSEQFHRKVNHSQDLRPLHKVIKAMSQTARTFPPARAAMEWTYRRTRIREKIIQFMMVDRGRPEILFDQVFSKEAAEILSGDLHMLNQQLDGAVPGAWRAHESFLPSDDSHDCGPLKAA